MEEGFFLSLFLSMLFGETDWNTIWKSKKRQNIELNIAGEVHYNTEKKKKTFSNNKWKQYSNAEFMMRQKKQNPFER